MDKHNLSTSIYNCFQADIWSMGITLYTIMFGENPFCDFEETIQADFKPPKSITSDLYQILSLLLDPNPEKRISPDNLSRHRWLNQQIDISQYPFENIVPNIEFKGNMASDYRRYSNESNCDIKSNKDLLTKT